MDMQNEIKPKKLVPKKFVVLLVCVASALFVMARIRYAAIASSLNLPFAAFVLILWTWGRRFDLVPCLNSRAPKVRRKAYVRVTTLRFVGTLGLTGLLAWLSNLHPALRPPFYHPISSFFIAIGFIPVCIISIALAASGVSFVSYYIKCVRCDWFGGLEDLEHNHGVCPVCGEERFWIPEHTETEFLGTTHEYEFCKHTTMKHYRNYYRIHTMGLNGIKAWTGKPWRAASFNWWKSQT